VLPDRENPLDSHKRCLRQSYQAVELGAADDFLAEQVEALEEVLIGVLVPQSSLHLLKKHQLLLEIGVCTRELGCLNEG
jgi:hypothetical protein